MQLLRRRLAQVHDTAHDWGHVAGQRGTVHNGPESAVCGHGVPVQATRVMGRHISVQTAPLQVRLHRKHIFFPGRVQLGRLMITLHKTNHFTTLNWYCRLVARLHKETHGNAPLSNR